MKRHIISTLILVACFVLAFSGRTHAQEEFPVPVNLESDEGKIRLSATGRYWGGWFSRQSPAGPAYDRRTKRLFIGSTDRAALEILDISDPYEPKKIIDVDLSRFGGEPNSMDAKNGIIAVLVQNAEDELAPSNIVLFNADGVMLSDALALERASRLKFTPNGRKLVVTIDSGVDENPLAPESAIAVIDLGQKNWRHCRHNPRKCRIRPNIQFAYFRDFNDKREELEAQGVRLIVPGATVSQDLRPDELAIAPNSRVAWVTMTANNAIAEVDLKQPRITNVFGLGLKDNDVEGNGLDASDKDGSIKIRTWPVKSFYQPDGMGLVWAGRNSYLVTANEGDPQTLLSPDGNEEDEDARVEDLILDPTNFPDAIALQERGNLGRLKVTIVDGDIDGDGDYDELFAFGGRSFALWGTDGRLHFDSGDDFEQITAQAIPVFFNAPEDENQFDNRSDDRGPEPETLDVGKIRGRHYAFVALERIGGIMVYDITDPHAPSFAQYINNRNFNVRPRDVCGEDKGQPGLPACPSAGDLEPEGVLFIAKKDSPIEVPLLVVSHELSDSTTLYRIDQKKDH